MPIPELGIIFGSNSCYMFAMSAGVVYSGTLVTIEGQPLRSFIFDPRLPPGAFANFTNFTSFSRMTVRNADPASMSNIGINNGVLDVAINVSDIVAVTTDANDDYFPEDDVSVLSGTGYNMFYAGNATPFNAYVPGPTPGTIKTDAEGVPIIQVLYGKFYFFSLTWFPLSNCDVTLSDQNTISNIVTSWLTSGTMPATQYYTTGSDCQIANVYSYCPFRQSCTAPCNGPCISPNQTCTFDTGKKQYFCSGNEPATTDLTPFYIITGLFLFLALVVIVLMFYKY